MNLAGSSILITGAAKRVGAVIAKTLAASGARHLILHYHHSRSEAEKLSRQLLLIGAKKVSLVQGDLVRMADCRRAAREAARKAPDLNAVIFNASAYFKTPFGSVKEKEWDTLLDANLKSIFFMAQELRKTLNANSPSRLVLLGDWSGLRPYVDFIPYCLSKTGVLYLTHALAKAMAPKVQVNAVLPGPVLLPPDMPRVQREAVRQATLLKRLGRPEDVAKAVRFFLEDANFSTGAWLTVDGGRLIA